MKPHRNSTNHVLAILLVADRAGNDWDQRGEASDQVGQGALQNSQTSLRRCKLPRLLYLLTTVVSDDSKSGRFADVQRRGFAVVLVPKQRRALAEGRTATNLLVGIGSMRGIAQREYPL